MRRAPGRLPPFSSLRSHALGALTLGLLCALGANAPASAQPAPPLPVEAQAIRPGIDLWTWATPTFSTDAAPQAIHVLRVDPARATLDLALARDQVMGREDVASMAARHEAVAAINAGFFAPTGDPTGVLRLDGRLVSDSRRARGAVALLDADGRQRLLFDQVTAHVLLRFEVDGKWDAVPVDGVDTPPAANRLVLLSPRFDARTGAAPGWAEWTLTAPHMRPAAPSNTGNTPIPRDGGVASYGGPVPPSLAAFHRAQRVEIRPTLTPRSGEPANDWHRALDVVSGAGLLLRGGQRLTTWDAEALSPKFAETRHPRTVIGHDAQGMIWLIAVDGRQPGRAAGMTFVELQALCERLGLVDALNLDGGGSTTMVVDGRVVNRPSDATGPRAVSDAILVRVR